MAYPTDSRLLERGRQYPVKLAVTLGIKLRQNYNRQASRLAAQVGRYAHARQYRCMMGATCILAHPGWSSLARHRS
ncbi:MAG: hypothetical protein JNL77_03560 [Nitrosomonas sp.]|nr:hypothetical protein [Nitrosomonas sp.]